MNTEVTVTSWGGRLMGSLKGMILGIILIVAAFYLIFWNEARSLHTTESLIQAEQVLISVPSSPINKANNLKVIYLSDMANTPDVLQDPVFDVSEQAIKLIRRVDMFQWEENKHDQKQNQLGGLQQTTTTYSYKKVWSEKPIDSSRFMHQEGHQNPGMPLSSFTQLAQNVMVGDFYLPNDMVAKISGEIMVDLTNKDYTNIQSHLQQPVQHVGGGLFIGKNIAQPEIGNLRITISKVLPQPVSIIAQQISNTLQPYMAPAGEPVELIVMGQQSAAQMVYTAQGNNQSLTWILRVVSLVMMIMGVSLLIDPIIVLAEVVPFFGAVVGFGAIIVAFMGGFSLWCIGIAICWFVVRPVLVVLLISGVVILIGTLLFVGDKK